jgi:putative transposase
VVKPALKKEVAGYLQQQHGLSQRKAASLVGSAASVLRYRSKRANDSPTIERLRELAAERSRFGYRRLHVLLRREELVLNIKKTHRLYRDAKLNLRTKKRRRITSSVRVVPESPSGVNQVWTMDFVHDNLACGRIFRTLNIMDAWSREALAIEADTSLNGKRVVRVLEQIVVRRGKPQMIQMDNGSEFRGIEVDQWAYRNQVKLHFIEPGKPTQNGKIESFNGKIESFNGRLRDECLNQEWFTSLFHARCVLAAWKDDYNTVRPHSALDYQTPHQWAQSQTSFSGLE